MFRKTSNPLIFAMFLLSIQLACIPFGDAWVKFSGHIKDIEGKPIKGAQIKILFDGKPESDHSETQSNELGEYNFFENSYPGEFEFVVIAAKDGYKIYTEKMTGKKANNLKNLEIVLYRN
ncbi:MAG: carboxypeptidase-like regulatory domain-containing protein [Pyrinomonadaceae bacterium]